MTGTISELINGGMLIAPSCAAAPINAHHALRKFDRAVRLISSKSALVDRAFRTSAESHPHRVIQLPISEKSAYWKYPANY